MIELIPVPEHGVRISHPDGAYLDVRETKMQVIVVGPMRAPIEYEEAVREALDSQDIYLVSVECMPCGEQGPDYEYMAMCRGFFSLIFEWRQASDKEVHDDGGGKPSPTLRLV